MFPNRENFYDAACSKPYSYLLTDIRADTPNHRRLSGRILEEDSQGVYVPNEYES